MMLFKYFLVFFYFILKCYSKEFEINQKILKKFHIKRIYFLETNSTFDITDIKLFKKSCINYIFTSYIDVNSIYKISFPSRTWFGTFQDPRLISLVIDLDTKKERFLLTRNGPARFNNQGEIKNVTNVHDLINYDHYDLHGEKVKVGVFLDYPISGLVNDTLGRLTVNGFVGEVWKILEWMLNIRSEYSSSMTMSLADPAFDNDTWMGLYHLLEKTEEIDVMIDGLVVVNETMESMQLSRPFLTQQMAAFVSLLSEKREEKFKIESTNELISLFMFFWCGMLLLLFVIFILMHMIQHKCFYQDEKENGFSFLANVFNILTILLNQGISDWGNTSKISQEIVLLNALMFIMLILMIYNGTSVSALTKGAQLLPFGSLEEMVTDGRYTFGVNCEGAWTPLFKYAGSGLLQNIFLKLMKPYPKNNCVQEIIDGFNRACTEKFVFGSTWESTSILIPQASCQLGILPRRYFSLNLALPMRKTWPHGRIIDISIQKLRQVGILNKIYLDTFSSPLYHQVDRWWPEVGFNHITIPVFILTFGILTSLLILSCEIFLFKFKKVNKTKKQKLTFKLGEATLKGLRLMTAARPSPHNLKMFS